MSLATVCLQLAVFVTAVKLLLVPTYRSTDFEVHRNWLAITHSLPISKWYVEATSEWTLDYPPFFAWFEWLLSQLARLVDPAMLDVHNLEYASKATVLFQRLSVIVTDIMLLSAAYALALDVTAPDVRQDGRRAPKGDCYGNCLHRGLALFFLVSCNVGLLLVDHVHFQYNGVMMGLLLWSLFAARTGFHLLSGLLFAALLNLKHLFLYAAPTYFVYLLRHHCCKGTALGPAITENPYPSAASTPAMGLGVGRSAAQLAVLGGGVVAIFGVSFGPFIALGQLPQVLHRLFPFGRGLLHAYWAANIWAPYAAIDKLLVVALPRLKMDMAHMGLRVKARTANMAGGLVGVSQFAVLPQVTPAITALAVLLALLPCLSALWMGDGRHDYIRRNLARAVSYSFLCGFVFGYHVHEKAILVALLPLAVEAVSNPRAATRFLVLATAGSYGLLPLLFQVQEYAAKVLLVVAYLAVSAATLRAQHMGTTGSTDGKGQTVGGSCVGASSANECREMRLVNQAGVLGLSAVFYLACFLAVELYVSVIHTAVPALHHRLSFAPLMLTSVYSSLGVLAVWLDMMVEWVRDILAGKQCASSLN